MYTRDIVCMQIQKAGWTSCKDVRIHDIVAVAEAELLRNTIVELAMSSECWDAARRTDAS